MYEEIQQTKRLMLCIAVNRVIQIVALQWQKYVNIITFISVTTEMQMALLVTQSNIVKGMIEYI